MFPISRVKHPVHSAGLQDNTNYSPGMKKPPNATDDFESHAGCQTKGVRL